MLRTTVGWSLSFVLALGGMAACSSTSTNGNGTGGNGSIVGGSTGSGGTAATGAGTASTGAGTTSTGGATAAACADQPITCVDATTAMGCNPDTGKVDTFSCVDELKALGIVSAGCTKDAVMGDFCSIDDFADQACSDGTGAFAYCENATSDTQVFNIYVNCFQDNNMGHTVIPCFSKYVTPTMKTSADCIMAEDNCFPGGPGSGGTGGGGGAAAAGGTTAMGGDTGAGGAP
jgi:hypothetical protein